MPFSKLDVLIVEEIGKDISGMEMDYAVTGRTDIRGIPTPSTPFIHKIGVFSLTPASHGNGQGIGVADYIPLSLTRQINLYDMYMNSITASVIKACVATCWEAEEEKVRLCIIRSTLHLDNIIISTSLVKDIERKKNVKVISSTKTLQFSHEEKLLTRCPKN